MQYLIMVYHAEGTGPQPPAEEFNQMIQAYGDLTQEMQDRGVFLGGNPLEPVSTATTVRVRDGKSETIDGPFAETKEVLGGYYLLDCKDLDEAIEFAAKIPTAAFGSVEVRPVMDM